MNYKYNICDAIWYAMGVVPRECIDCGDHDIRPARLDELRGDEIDDKAFGGSSEY